MVNMNEIEVSLKSLGVDWTGYTPPGGPEWQEQFENHIAPILRESRAKAVAELVAIKSRARERNRALAFLDCASDALNALRANLVAENSKSRSVTLAAEADSLLAIIASFRDRCQQELDDNDIEKDRAEIEGDIFFLSNIMAYFKGDALLDRMLFALFQIPVKYRTRLLRLAVKLLPVIENAREVIRRSNSFLQQHICALLAEPFRSLDAAYAYVSPGLRAQLRRVKQLGERAWDETPSLPRFSGKFN